jgi:protein tyrosine phosphatase (PTP) superfamily phosphohydrolase (DUF442 family)
VAAAEPPITAAEPQAAAPAKRDSIPDNWAKPLQLDGVENGYQVSPGLYRSAQPTAAGLKNLKERGVKTVVTLRAFHSDRQAAGDTGLVCESISMLAWEPTEKDVVRFLKLASDPDKSPVLVHCQYGADRTGLMCAVYRVAVEGWTKEAAIEEMKHERYGFHKLWVNIPPWIEKLDIDKIREQAGLPIPQTTAAQSAP